MIKNLKINVNRDIQIDKKYIHKIVKELQKELEFTIDSIHINFVNREEIMRINKEYLNHYYSTDIITFNYSESQKKLESEIYISIDDAAYNSKKYGVSLKEEVMRLIIHGFLHLLGFNDQSQNEKSVMKRLENKLFNRYKLIIN